MKEIDKRKLYLQVRYRAVMLQLNMEQRRVVERCFGITRVIRNHLLLLTKDFTDSQARAKDFTFRELEAEILRLMNTRNDGLLTDEAITPTFLRGVLLAWLSEWRDFRSHRIERPKFQQHQDSQRLYFMDRGFEYTENKFKVEHLGLDLFLESSRYTLSHKAEMHLLKRDAQGNYWLYSLHESSKYLPDTSQDETTINWCEKILTIENELRISRRRDLGISGSKRKDQRIDNENRLSILRKVTLDRLLRARDAKIQEYQAQAAA